MYLQWQVCRASGCTVCFTESFTHRNAILLLRQSSTSSTSSSRHSRHRQHCAHPSIVNIVDIVRRQHRPHRPSSTSSTLSCPEREAAQMWELPPTPPDSEDGDGPAPTPARGRGRGRPAGVVGSRLARQLRDDALEKAGLLDGPVAARASAARRCRGRALSCRSRTQTVKSLSEIVCKGNTRKLKS